MTNTTALVHVYSGADKDHLITVIPIIDAGVVTDDGIRPTSDEGLIHITKFQLRAQKAGSEEDVERFHYEVERKS